jgi:hypothetical protein
MGWEELSFFWVGWVRVCFSDTPFVVIWTAEVMNEH